MPLSGVLKCVCLPSGFWSRPTAQEAEDTHPGLQQNTNKAVRAMGAPPGHKASPGRSLLGKIISDWLAVRSDLLFANPTSALGK